MPLGIGMQAVGLPVAEITDMGVGKGVKAADAVEIDHRDGPDTAGLADFCDIGIDIKSQPVGERFVGLDVPFAEARICMNMILLRSYAKRLSI